MAMATWRIIVNVALAVLLTNLIDSKIITVPYHQDDCECEDRVVITEDMEWQTNDDGDTVYHGNFSFAKKLEQPVWIDAKIEMNRRGKWRFFIQQSFHNVCSNLFENDMPYSFWVKNVPREQLECPLTPEKSPVNLRDSVFDGDVTKFMDLTPDDLGDYRIIITAFGQVEGVTRKVACFIVYYDVVEVDD